MGRQWKARYRITPGVTLQEGSIIMQKIIILLFLTLLISCSEEKQPEQSKTAAQPSQNISVTSHPVNSATVPPKPNIRKPTDEQHRKFEADIKDVEDQLRCLPTRGNPNPCPGQ
jgi:hypothetical protein